MTDIHEPDDGGGLTTATATGPSHDGHDPDGPGTGAPGAAAHRRHHPVRDVLLLMAGVVAIAVLVVALSYAFRTRPGAKSLSSAGQQFHSTSTTAPTARNFALPPAGVYQVTGSGTESINKPPNSQTDSPTMPVSVTYLPGGCWRWHIDYNSAAWHQYDFCPVGTRLLLTAQSNYQAWNFGITSVTNLATFTCNPPTPIVVASPRVGATYPLVCVGTNTAVAGTSTSKGPVTITGTGALTVGGVKVPAIHITRTQVITGAQTGRLNETWWFDAATGMPLASSRNYRLVTNSPIGNITYTEVGSWTLKSLTPTIS